MAFKRTPHTSGDMPAVLVIEPTRFERRCLIRLMRAAGAERVAEAADIETARRLLSLRRAPQWMLVADPDHLPGDGMSLLRGLADEHAFTAILLTQRRAPAADELRSHAQRSGVPILAALRKPISAEEAGTLLRSFAQAPGGRTVTPMLSTDELNDCLRTGRVRARFQPKIDLDSGRPVACQAISLVSHARYGEVSAAGYRHAAAQLGAQRVMTATVLREAAALVRSLRAKNLMAKVSVSLALDVLSEAGDASALDSYVRTLGISASDLALEIDATRQAAGTAHLADNLARLKLRGYALALDGPAAAGDFAGAAQAHFSELKLSWTAMTRDANGTPDRQKMAAAISSARKLGMAVCAVGVRTVADLHLARLEGIDLGQGELFADSMPAAETLIWMEREERTRSFADRSPRLDRQAERA
jgi:EAL domain-containing protein (putative c-di-GMP-specific phosphodiesterase class I)